MSSRQGEEGQPGLPGEPGSGGGGAGGRGGRGGRGASLSTGWRRYRGVVGYVSLVLFFALAMELHHERDQNRIRDVQADVCANATIVAANQKLVLRYLIDLRVAALASPYLRIEAQRELIGLEKALRKLQAEGNPCASLSD